MERKWCMVLQDLYENMTLLIHPFLALLFSFSPSLPHPRCFPRSRSLAVSWLISTQIQNDDDNICWLSKFPSSKSEFSLPVNILLTSINISVCYHTVCRGMCLFGPLIVFVNHESHWNYEKTCPGSLESSSDISPGCLTPAQSIKGLSWWTGSPLVQ